jgi:protein tyrosine phosphatase (PTP) superfamily phosphohydrolase (DUF442 family)
MVRRLSPEVRLTTPFDALRDVVNACQALPGLVTGGQPTAEQFEAFAAAGGDLVLDIRDPREPRPLDQAAVLERLGIEYVVVPVSAATQDDATLDRIREFLRRAKGRSALFHCASANRVGAALIPYLVLDEGMEEPDAIDAALRLGLRSPDLLAWAVDYARRHQK